MIMCWFAPNNRWGKSEKVWIELSDVLSQSSLKGLMVVELEGEDALLGDDGDLPDTSLLEVLGVLVSGRFDSEYHRERDRVLRENRGWLRRRVGSRRLVEGLPRFRARRAEVAKDWEGSEGSIEGL